ncbi:MAG: LamG-like jellyroll fold domain-containing protein [Chitinophagales bacterium]
MKNQKLFVYDALLVCVCMLCFMHTGILHAQAGDLGYYRFEEGIAGTSAIDPILDNSPLGNDGTPSGGPVYSSAVPVDIIPGTGASNELCLSSTSDADIVTFPGVFPFNNVGNATLELWVKYDGGASYAQILWGNTDGTDANRFNLFISNGWLCFDYRNSAGGLHPIFGEADGVHFINGVWHHVAVVREGLQYAIYMDGVLEKFRYDYSPDFPTSVGWMVVGRPGFGFNGAVDEIRLSSYALSQEELLAQTSYIHSNIRFEEGVAGALMTSPVIDSSPLGFNGTPLNTPAFSSDIPAQFVPDPGENNTLSLIGMEGNDIIRFPGTFAFNNFVDATLEIWVKNTSDAENSILWGRPDDLDVNRFNLFTTGGELCFDYRDASATLHSIMGPGDGIPFSDNEWHYIAIVRQYVTYSFYVDGVLQKVRNDAYTVLPTSNGWQIGGRTGGPFYGLIDEVRVWNRALTESEIQNNYISSGCTNMLACNYDPEADLDDGSCVLPVAEIPNGIDDDCDGMIDNVHGTALQFDGSNDYVSIPDNPALDLTTTDPFTIECWIRLDNATGQPHFFGKRPGCGTGINYQLFYDASSQILGFGGEAGTVITYGGGLTEGEWTHVAVSCDGETCTMYINGCDVNTQMQSLVLSDPNSADLVFGNSGTCPNNVNGALDEFRIWNYARSGSEIRTAMLSGLDPLDEPGLMAYYDFNDGVPYGNNTAITTTMSGVAAVPDGSLHNFFLLGTTSNFIPGAGSDVYYMLYADNDGDGYGDAAASVFSICSDISGYVEDNTDCDDTDPAVFPIAETCNGLDDDCDGLYDELNGNALDFDWGDDYVSIPDDPAFNFEPGEPFTLELWVYRQGALSEEHILGKRAGCAGGDSYNYQLLYTDYGGAAGRIGFGGNTTNVDINERLEPNMWTHIAVTYDGDTMRIYKNGCYKNKLGTTHLGPLNTSDFKLGRSGSCSGFNGIVDELRIWNYARSEEQIKDNMLNELDPIAESGLLAYYTFDQGIAGGSNPGETILFDQTASGLNGTLHAFDLSGSASNWVQSASTVAYITVYQDLDGDGFGDPDAPIHICCDLPAFASYDNTDCDDANASIYPGADELCNYLDDNCNGAIDDGAPEITFYADADNDGFGDAFSFTESCFAPEGFVDNDTDCDDTNEDIHPGVEEICNELDDNCDGFVDEGIVTNLYFADADNDGYGDATSTLETCGAAPEGYILDDSDCDDTNMDVHPGVEDICNGIDDDCDGNIDVIDVEITAAGPTEFCNGGFVELDATTGAGFTYKWLKNDHIIPGATLPSFLANQPGTYKVIVSRAGGCHDTSNVITVVMHPYPAGTVQIFPDNNLCTAPYAGSARLRAANGAGYSYQWYELLHGIIYAGTSRTFIATHVGSYYCAVTSTYGCTTYSDTVQIINSCRDGQDAFSENESWGIYPNPSDGIFYIDGHFTCSDGTVFIEMLSALGETILTTSSQYADGALHATLQVDDYIPAGTYFIRLTCDESVQIKPLILSR